MLEIKMNEVVLETKGIVGNIKARSRICLVARSPVEPAEGKLAYEQNDVITLPGRVSRRDGVQHRRV
jgi:hypothetical protein